MNIDIKDDRQMRALTGVTVKQFEIILESFSQVYQEWQWQVYQEGLLNGSRSRRPGGGQKGALPTMREKLFFLMYYLKVYPTFDVLGTHFGMGRSKANENVHKLMPFLMESLSQLDVMPRREFGSVEEMREVLADIETLLVDVTERAHRRPENDEKQRAHYSGKKRSIP